MSEPSPKPSFPDEASPGVHVPRRHLVPGLRVLLADDSRVSLLSLQRALEWMGHRPVCVSDGSAALNFFEQSDAPTLAILDWNMPGATGPEICRRVRSVSRSSYTYLVLLTSRTEKVDVVAGLDAGADDFMSKPFDREELRARITAGERILALESVLAGKVAELASERAHVEQLQGLLPICMHCKSIRRGDEAWEKLESYIESRSGARFSHGLCDSCLTEKYPDEDP